MSQLTLFDSSRFVGQYSVTDQARQKQNLSVGSKIVSQVNKGLNQYYSDKKKKDPSFKIPF